MHIIMLTCNFDELFNESHSLDNIRFPTDFRDDPVHFLIDQL